jgi:ribonucleoside-diphosphate reductase alpha chain
MGFQDCLHIARAVRLDGRRRVRRPLDGSRLLLRLLASTELAEERGRYFYRGSLWDRGILPQDSLKLLAKSAAAT